MILGHLNIPNKGKLCGRIMLSRKAILIKFMQHKKNLHL